MKNSWNRHALNSRGLNKDVVTGRSSSRRTRKLIACSGLLMLLGVSLAAASPRAEEKPGDRQARMTPRAEVLESVLGNQREKAVTRDDLMAERRERRRYKNLPPRPRGLAPIELSDESVPPAKRLWREESQVEDTEAMDRIWRFELQEPDGRKLRNYEAFKKMPSEAPPGTKVLQSEWESIGNGIYDPNSSKHHRTGRIRAAQYVYDDELGYTTLYVASSGGGLFRLVNVLFLNIWEPLTDNLGAEAMAGAFLVDETDSSRILFGTGDWSRRGGTGLYRTLNGGDSWERMPLDPFPFNTYRIVQDSQDPDVVLLVGLRSYNPSNRPCGIWRSENFGSTWTQIYDGPVTDLVQDPAYPQYWLAGAPGVGVLESFDGGQTFGPIWGSGGAGLAGSVMGRIDYAISESQPNYHYLLSANMGDNNLYGIFRSTDYGYNWTRIDQGDFMSMGIAHSTGAIAVDPDDHRRLFVGMGGGQWTENADANPADICWHLNAGSTGGCGGNFDGGHVDFHSFTFQPDAISPGNTRVIVTNDGGVYLYDYAADTVDGTINLMGLNVSQHWPNEMATLASSRTDPDVSLAGTFDNGVVRIDVGASQKVRAISGGDGGKVSISPDDVNDVAFSFGLGWNRYFSLNGGTSRHDIDCLVAQPSMGTPGIQVDQTPGFGHFMFTYDDRNLFAKPMGTTCNWRRVNPSANPIGPSNFFMKQMDQANNPFKYIFYATGQWSERVYVLEGAPVGGPFPQSRTTAQLGSLVPEDRTPPTGPMAPRDAAVFADRSSLQWETVYYTSRTGRPVQAWMSTNAGDTWEDVSGNLRTLLPDAHFRELVGNPSNLNQLFLATDVGVMRSDDRGATWYRYMNGLPDVIDAMSIELVFDSTAEPTLYIGTFGRGWWKRVIDDAPAEAGS